MPAILIAIVVVIFCIALLTAAYEKATNAVCRSKKRLDGKTAIVTGGTAGMGLEIAKDFAQRGARVIIACPFEKEGLNAQKQIIEETENEAVVFKLLDLGSLKSTREFAADILKNEDRLDILVNNAGLSAPLKMTADGLNFVMQVNYFSHFLLTILLIPLLRNSGKPGQPSRIVNTASVFHNVGVVDIEDLNYNKYFFDIRVYANSKMCVLLFTKELAKRLKDSNVVVNCVDPGAVGTRIFQGWNKYLGLILTWICILMFKNPWQGAQTAIHVALDEKTGEVNGKYFKNCKLISPTKLATDEKVAKKLWEETTRLVKLGVEEINNCFK